MAQGFPKINKYVSGIIKTVINEWLSGIHNYTFEDALKPIVEIGRTTQGKLGTINPLELNQQINFFTTSG